MKKMIFTIAGSLLIGFAAHAQNDSTLINTQPTTVPSTQPTNIPQPNLPTEPDGTATQNPVVPPTPSQQYNNDRVIIRRSDIPPSLKQTLSNQQYSGWENSTFYQDRRTNDYIMDIGTGNTKRTYRFNSSGKAIDNSKAIGGGIDN